VNAVLRRPGMYGRDETAEQLLLSAMAAVDGSSTRWAAEFAGLRDRRAFTATYAAAVSEGRFTPSKPHHGTTDHVAAFSPGLRHIHLVDGRRD
jgi:hypothetical protein